MKDEELIEKIEAVRQELEDQKSIHESLKKMYGLNDQIQKLAEGFQAFNKVFENEKGE
jgi:uncharacterized coiled-coil DUF342 family protein